MGREELIFSVNMAIMEAVYIWWNIWKTTSSPYDSIPPNLKILIDYIEEYNGRKFNKKKGLWD